MKNTNSDPLDFFKLFQIDNTKSCIFQAVTVEETAETFHKIKTKGTEDIYGVSTRILKLIQDSTIVLPVTIITQA